MHAVASLLNFKGFLIAVYIYIHTHTFTWCHNVNRKPKGTQSETLHAKKCKINTDKHDYLSAGYVCRTVKFDVMKTKRKDKEELLFCAVGDWFWNWGSGIGRCFTAGCSQIKIGS